MAKKTAKEIAADESKGLYKQKHRYWYRYWHGGKEHYHNCQTTNLEEAKEEKKRFLASARFGKALAAKSWDKEIEEYIVDRQAKGSMKESTERGVRSVLNVFQTLNPKIKRPEDVTYEDLVDFWKKSRVESDSTGRTYLVTLQAFLKDRGLLRKRFAIPKTAKIGARETYEKMEVINSWIDSCDDVDLKYVLYCLGHMGMRAGEVKFSQVDWYQDGICKIPAKMPYRTKKGAKKIWSPKNGTGRAIPITPEFQAYLDTYLVDKEGLVIKSKKSKDGTWDFRIPLEKYMKEVGSPDFFPHAFRHSWITYLMDTGYSIQDVSIWSGDRLETLQKHYWKKHTEAGALDVTGKKKTSKLEGEVEELKAMMGQMLGLVKKSKDKTTKKKITNADVFEELVNSPATAELAEQFSTAVMLDKMDKAQRKEFLNSLPF